MVVALPHVHLFPDRSKTFAVCFAIKGVALSDLALGSEVRYKGEWVIAEQPLYSV